MECHQHSAIFRRVYPNLKEIMRRSRDIIDGAADENKSERIWSFPDGRTIEFGAVQHEDNKKDWQGRPHDLKAFDELPEFTESQYVFISGWNRTTDPGQRTRVLATGNPPTDEAGSWIIRRWAAWLDPEHPNPAKPGELRWYAVVDGKERECEDEQPFEHNGETVIPRSRTFIRARLDDNPYYSQDGRYRSVLQSLPEPLRSQLLYGDFEATQAPNPWQVIPTEWVRAAQKRWLEREKPDTPLVHAGLDPSRGGEDQTALSKRYENWVAEPVAWPGRVCVDGPTVAELVRQQLDGERVMTINMDVAGIGSSVYDSLVTMFRCVLPVNSSNKSEYYDRSGKLKMRNKRAELYWRMRDALDPIYGDDMALPPGNEVLADLCAGTYKLTTAGVQVEEKEEIKQRIGRSPDVGEAIMLSVLPGAETYEDLAGLGNIEGFQSRWTE